jgi:hypothetical protein
VSGFVAVMTVRKLRWGEAEKRAALKLGARPVLGPLCLRVEGQQVASSRWHIRTHTHSLSLTQTHEHVQTPMLASGTPALINPPTQHIHAKKPTSPRNAEARTQMRRRPAPPQASLQHSEHKRPGKFGLWRQFETPPPAQRFGYAAKLCPLGGSSCSGWGLVVMI